MHEQLNLLRRLYDEPGAEDPPTGASPEVEAFKAAKEALDRLPKQRPDPAVIDAVVAAAADAVLGPVRALYDEPGAAPDTPEAEALRPVREALDRLPKQRPEPATLEAVLAAAAVPAPTRAADRPADPPARGRVRRRRSLSALGGMLALALAVGAGLWLGRGAEPEAPVVAEATPPSAPDATPDTAVSEAQPEAEPAVSGQLAAASNAASRREAEPVQAARQAAPPPPAPAEVRPAVVEPLPVAATLIVADADAAETLPLADGEDELRLLYLRLLEMEEAQAGLNWDGPPVPLGEQPAEARPTSGWMQVRVER